MHPPLKLRYTHRLWFLLYVLLMPCFASAQQSDNENGTFTNPVIWSDFPDNDIIRVNETYYMVSTSMYFSPGVPLLKSKDLVNWEYTADVLPQLKSHPFY